MSNEALKKIPEWIWWSLCPVFGALTIAYAGYLTKTNRWIQIGLGMKNPYLIKSAPRGAILPNNRETARLIADIRGKVDINKCSKDDLVHVLGLPIAYANNIELIKAEGYQFLHIEELTELADVPSKYCETIEPLVVFSYYEQLETSDPVNWQRLNVLPISELVELGLDRSIAIAICNERQLHGNYRSLIEVKRRTGLPINLYKHLI
jgi:DNA uptake protein ComE-like DNA-binding protein